MSIVPNQLALRPTWKENLGLLMVAIIAAASVLFFFEVSGVLSLTSTIHEHSVAVTAALLSHTDSGLQQRLLTLPAAGIACRELCIITRVWIMSACRPDGVGDDWRTPANLSFLCITAFGRRQRGDFT